MGAQKAAIAAARLPAVAKRPRAYVRADRRRFAIGVGCAAALHAALLLGVYRSQPRIMGERDGQPEGMSVELVDAADLASRTSTPSAPMQPSMPSTAQPLAPQPPQPEAAQPATPQQSMARAIEQDNPNALQLPGAPAKAGATPPASEPKPKVQPHAPTQPQSMPQPNQPLQLSMPDSAIADFRRSAAATRPQGITRSGENDEFGRGVIRALRKTLPPSDLHGRVMVRLVLNDNGNLQDVRVVSGSGEPLLDQSVVFAVRQSSFPIPPAGSTPADRTFLVTYIYR